ncbi:MAG: hypothetical protein U1F87_19355, partial [Kiritimatiellia bacterium]
GAFVHLLLRTVFPVTLDVLDDRLAVAGAWSGRLRQRSRDARAVEVAAEWRAAGAGLVAETHRLP